MSNDQSNVGSGMVPCRKNCRCVDCRIEAKDAEIERLTTEREERIDKWMELIEEKDERIAELEKINYNLTRDNIEQANKLAALEVSDE